MGRPPGGRPLAVLESLAARPLALGIGVCLLLPSLGAGLAIDDHMHALALADGPREPCYPLSAGDLFAFVPADRGCTRELMEIGVLPWWTTPKLLLAFFRPVSAATHVLDHALYPGVPWAMHAHSLLWLLCLVLAARRLYGVVAPGAAALAGLLYAWDDAHAVPAGWLANRNALLAGVFGCLALAAHARGRRGGGPGWAIAAVGAFVVSIFSAEGGVATGAYLAAYALWLDDGTVARRALSLVPYGVVTAAWRVASAAMGYGAYGSELYLDPAQEPVTFLLAVMGRLPILVLAAVGPSVADGWVMLPDAARPAAGAAAAALLALLAWAVLPVLARDRAARFFGTGMTLAAIPVCATLPSDRLLTFTALGAIGLVACVLRGAALVRASRVVVPILLVIHAGLAPLTLPLRSLAMGWLGAGIEESLERVGDDDAVGGRTVIFVNPPTDFIPSYLALLRAAHGRPLPAATRTLCLGLGATRLERAGTQELLISREAGFLSRPLERLVRSSADPMARGYRVSLRGLDAEVLDVTSSGFPRQVRLRFDVPLEDPSLLWVAWPGRPGGTWAPPAVGASVELPEVALSHVIRPSVSGSGPSVRSGGPPPGAGPAR